jgi:hypothetical protein
VLCVIQTIGPTGLLVLTLALEVQGGIC